LGEGSGAFYNQTPRATADRSGRIWVVWSGRERSGSSPWSIYVVRRESGAWSEPECVSPRDENARAPAIAASADGGIWIAWHAGTGEGMRIRVLHREGGELHPTRDPRGA
jgi:hypothetical protein